MEARYCRDNNRSQRYIKAKQVDIVLQSLQTGRRQDTGLRPARRKIADSLLVHRENNIVKRTVLSEPLYRSSRHRGQDVRRRIQPREIHDKPENRRRQNFRYSIENRSVEGPGRGPSTYRLLESLRAAALEGVGPVDQCKLHFRTLSALFPPHSHCCFAEARQIG